MNNLKKKKKRYMFITGVNAKKDPVSVEILVAGLARMIKTVGLATWLESPKEPIRSFQLNVGKDKEKTLDYMELIFTCSIRKEQLNAIRNTFFEYYPDGYIRSVEMANY